MRHRHAGRWIVLASGTLATGLAALALVVGGPSPAASEATGASPAAALGQAEPAPRERAAFPDPEGVADGGPGISAQQVVVGELGTPQWAPSIIFNDSADSTTLELPITGGTFDLVFLSTEDILTADASLPSPASSFPDLAGKLIRLYDDGTNGDRVAGDRIFSRSGIMASGALEHDGGTHQLVRSFAWFFREGPGGALARSLSGNVGVVDASQRGAVAVETVSDALSQTSHALFLVDDGTVFPGYPEVRIDDAIVDCRGCQVLIERFGDVFDFILLQTREVLSEQPDCGCAAFHFSVRNDVEGIGTPVVDVFLHPDGRPPDTFSDGRLLGLVFSDQIDGWPLSHELMHQWAVYAAESLGWIDGAGHYLNTTSGNGLMYAGSPTPSIVSNGDGTFRLETPLGNSTPTFSPIELYLAGLLPRQEVTPITVLEGAIDVSDPQRVTATTARQIRIDDIVAVEGTRVPAFGQAPTTLSVGTLVVSDRAFTEAEYAFITLALRYWASDQQYDGSGPPPWRTATLGQSTLQVALPVAAPFDPTTVAVAATLAPGDFVSSSVARDERALYRVTGVPEGAELTIRLTGSGGDADIYARAGLPPGASLAMVANLSRESGVTETIVVPVAAGGDWWIVVLGSSGAPTFTLTVTTVGGTVVPDTTVVVDQTLAGGAQEWQGADSSAAAELTTPGSVLWRWTGAAWTFFALDAQGNPVAGSDDFSLTTGDTLFASLG